MVEPPCADASGGDTEAPEHLSTSMYMAIVFPQKPEPLYIAQRQYAEPNAARHCPNSNFLKGVKWSPDGACCLTVSDDNWLRVFDLPQDCLSTPAPASALHVGGTGDAATCHNGAGDVGDDSLQAALVAVEGETVYDYCWYSRMQAMDPVSCCFASTSRGHPIHLWDANSGDLRCTYRGYDDVDEVTAAYSLAFSPDGMRLYAGPDLSVSRRLWSGPVYRETVPGPLKGYNRCFKVFDITRPGRDSKRIATHRKQQEGVPGIISCIAASSDQTQLAVGSYSGAIGVLDARTCELLYVLRGHTGGVTQVLFTRDNNFLLSGARQDGQLLCWDVRYSAEAVYNMTRDTATTNQRIHFDVEPCQRHLATGTQTGHVQVFDLQTGEQVDSLCAAADVVNGCEFHPSLPLLATASGHRRYPLEPDSDADVDVDGVEVPAAGLSSAPSKTSNSAGRWSPTNALRIWRLRYEMHNAPYTADGQEAEVVNNGDECAGYSG